MLYHMVIRLLLGTLLLGALLLGALLLALSGELSTNLPGVSLTPRGLVNGNTSATTTGLLLRLSLATGFSWSGRSDGYTATTTTTSLTTLHILSIKQRHKLGQSGSDLLFNRHFSTSCKKSSFVDILSILENLCTFY